jgi:dTDP-glucose 4,6-dehydratase
MKVITNGKIGSKYHFSGEKYFTIKDIIKDVLHIKKYPWDKLIEQSVERKGKDKNYYLDCTKTKRELHWKYKIGLKIGIKKTVKYYDSIINNINKKDINFKIKK